MKNTITVLVVGKPNTGKTTLAEEISAHLTQLGVETEIEGERLGPAGQATIGFLTKSVRARTRVVIRQEQCKRKAEEAEAEVQTLEAERAATEELWAWACQQDENTTVRVGWVADRLAAILGKDE